MTGPLAGIQVVDLSSYVAGPYAAMMLADLGADVIKVESLEGDSFRELPGFFGWNRGKRSIALDLKTPEGLEIVERLVKNADVAIENMRPGVADRLGVGYAHLSALNPRLVYCSITAFGSTGPDAARPGFDPLFQAMGGVMVLQGFGGPPQYVRIAITDYYAAALGCQAILAGLFARARSGRGQKVETSLLQAVLALQSGNVSFYPGKDTRLRENPSYRLYQAEDGEWLFVACGNQAFWVKLCKALDLGALADDPCFASWPLRVENGHVLAPLLEARFRKRPRAEWLETLAAHDVPCAPVQSLQQFLWGPAVGRLSLLRQYRHPEVGPLSLMAQPLVFSETPASDPGAPPTLGQHTDAVLAAIGYDRAEIEDLLRRGVVAGGATT